MFPPNTRVLIVDDMSAMRMMVRTRLSELGMKTVMEAKNGQEGFDILQQQLAAGSPIQLVLSDWNMPVMTGIDLLRKVRGTEGLKDVPFLMITAEGEKHQIIEAIKLGVSQYLIKPIDAAILKGKLEETWKKFSEVSGG